MYISHMMRLRKRLKRSRRYNPPRGVRIVRRMKFEPILATLSGIKVRSQYEKRCADYLFGKGIEFRYEPLILLEGRKYRPDFYLPEYDVFLEICGYGHMPFYHNRIEQKKRIYDKENMKVIFIHYNGRGPIEAMVESALKGLISGEYNDSPNRS